MPRFPPIPEDQLSGAQTQVHERVADIFSRFPSELKWKNEDGLILGPYSSLFYTEDLSEAWFAVASAVTRQQRFTAKEKELCILAVISQHDVPYLLYAHSHIGIVLGFTKSQVQLAVHGKLPDNLNERESATYSLALTLTKERCSLTNETFEETKKILGRDGIAGVAHIVSGYIYVAILTSISHCGAPDPGEGMFLATKNPELLRE